MSSHVAHYFAAFAVILTQSTLVSVNGQCTIDGCGNGEPPISIVTELQQLSVEAVLQLSIQVQSIRELLNESYQQKKSQHDTANKSCQAVDKCPQEHDVYIKIQNICEFLNDSLQQMKTHHGSVMTSLQAVDRRRLQEQDIWFKQGQSIHELLHESFQEIKSQHDAAMRRQNDTAMRSHLDLILRSQHAVERRSQDHDSSIKQVQSIYKLLNESFQQMKSQHDTIMKGLEAVNRRLQEHDIYIKNQNGNAWKLANGICGPTAEVCDCSDIKASGQIANGVYEVCAGYLRDRVCTNTFCDMDAANGASLVFQRRKDGRVNFYRTWAEYKEGFGDRNSEFWLGNEMLYLLTSKRNYKLRVDLEDFEGAKRYAEYARFSISSSTNNYTLAVSGYSGNAGDSLNYHSGQQFSTKDVDNDKSNGSVGCAITFRGAWWYNSCLVSNLNGIYHRGNYSGSASSQNGIQWVKWYAWWYSLKSTEMKLVPLA